MTHNKVKCKLCHDKGYIRDSKKKTINVCSCIRNVCSCGGQVPYFFRNEEQNILERCPCYISRIQIQKVRKLFRNSALGAGYYFKFLEDFKIKDPNGKFLQSVKLRDFIIRFLDEFSPDKKNKGFLLWSPVKGNGKTLSASIVLNELIFNYALKGRYLKLSSSYFGMIKKSYSDTNIKGMEQDIIRTYINYDVLVIDDFGTQRDTSWETEKFYELIDGRCENQKLTIITSNIDLSNIEEKISSDRIYSRIAEMCKIIEVTAPSYRLGMFEKETC